MYEPRERKLTVVFGVLLAVAGVILVALTSLMALGVFGDLEPKYYIPLALFWVIGGYVAYVGLTFFRKNPS